MCNNNIMKEYTIKEQETFFHEEAHIYFNSKEDFDKFSSSFKKNPDWALRNKSRWNPVRSITQFLGEAFPFSGGDLKITKAWFEKEARYKGLDEGEIEKAVNNMTRIEEYLSESVKRSQEEGNVGHEDIQDFIENLIMNGKKSANDSVNPYWKAFAEALVDETTLLGEYVRNIEQVLPSEIPVIAQTPNGLVTYAGKWDLLVKMKDGTYSLIDIKTGSNVVKDKKTKVGIQLNAYRNLIKETMGIEVDNLLCWELSYTIPYREVEKKLTAEKSKIKRESKKGNEVNKTRLIELKNELELLKDEKGNRKYYFKRHDFTKSDSYQEIMTGVQLILKGKESAGGD